MWAGLTLTDNFHLLGTSRALPQWRNTALNAKSSGSRLADRELKQSREMAAIVEIMVIMFAAGLCGMLLCAKHYANSAVLLSFSPPGDLEKKGPSFLPRG